MPHISYLPFAAVDSELQAVMHEYDDELGGSEFVQVFAHAPEVFKGWRIVTFVGYGRFIYALGLEIGKTCPLPHPDGRNQR